MFAILADIIKFVNYVKYDISCFKGSLMLTQPRKHGHKDMRHTSAVYDIR